MKKNLLILILSFIFSINANAQASAEYTNLSIDQLVAQADSLEGKKVEVIGLVAHMCGVDGHKMKLKSPSGAILKIVPNNPKDSFDSKLKKQLVSVQGILEVKRIEKSYVDRMEKEGTLLCHIDHTPCKDKPWVNNKIETGADVEIVKKDIAKLRKIMEDSGKNYINSICVHATNVRLLNN